MPSRSSVSQFFAIRAQWLVWLCTLGGLTAPLSRALPTNHVPWLQWLVELAAHWQWVYATVGAVAMGLVAWMARRRAWRLAVPALVVAGSFVWQPATLPPAAEPGAASANVLKVSTANLNLDTTDFTPLRQWLASANAPDVVVLQEFTERAQRNFDCIALAESMGGGGHAQACGFRMPVARLPELLTGVFNA